MGPNGGQLVRGHDHLAEQQGCGTDNLRNHADHADDRVDLRQVPAAGSELFPDIGNRVDADHVDSLVREEQHVFRHGLKDCRVPVVQIPLIGIEGREDDFTAVVHPGEIPRCGRRKDLRHMLFIFVRNIPVVIEKIETAVVRITGTGFPGPFMVLAGVVHDEVHADADVLPVAARRELFQILHGAELGIHGAEIGDRVPAVTAALRTLEERHQVQVIDAAFLQIRNFLPHALKRAGKRFHVQAHAEQTAVPVPAGVLLALCVQFLQRRRPVFPAGPEHGGQGSEELRTVSVKLRKKPFQFVTMMCQPCFERTHSAACRLFLLLFHVVSFWLFCLFSARYAKARITVSASRSPEMRTEPDSRVSPVSNAA